MTRRKWAVLGVVACLGLLEMGARYAGFGHPLLYRPSSAGYELRAGQSVYRLGKTTHINAHGTRGPETGPMPPAGTVRILVLGDSVANGGAQINDAQTWPLLLQRSISRPGKACEVLNAAAGGWALQNEQGWLAEHGTLGAKIIILEINDQDLDQAFAGTDILDSNPSFPTRNPPYALAEIMTRYVLPRLGMGSGGADPGSTASAFQHRNVEPERSAVAKINAMAQANGARLAIFYWDTNLPAHPDAVAARNALFALADHEKIQVLRPLLIGKPGSQALFRDQIHPNANGNAAIAAFLAAHLAL
eukprot:gene15543-15690_t